LRADALDLAGGQLSVIRTVIEVARHRSFKPFPKSAAGRRTVPLPPCLVAAIREHIERWPSASRCCRCRRVTPRPTRHNLLGLRHSPELRTGVVQGVFSTTTREGGPRAFEIWVTPWMTSPIGGEDISVWLKGVVTCRRVIGR
jgi:hypothetical protein